MNISLEKGTLTTQDSATLTLTNQSDPSFEISSTNFFVKSQDIRFLVEMPENWSYVQLGDYDLKIEIPNKTIPILRGAVEIVKHCKNDCACERKELKSVEGNNPQWGNFKIFYHSDFTWNQFCGF